jgi:hypothetical protein
MMRDDDLGNLGRIRARRKKARPQKESIHVSQPEPAPGANETYEGNL